MRIIKIVLTVFLLCRCVTVLAAASSDSIVDAINASLHQEVKRTAESVAKISKIEAPKPVAIIPADWLLKITQQLTFQSEANWPLPRQRIIWYLQHKNLLEQQIMQNRSVIYSLYLQLKDQSLPMELVLSPLLTRGAALSIDKGALMALQKSQPIFNNKLLLVAAYQAGEKTVLQATANKADTLFWDLPLPDTTKEYVANLVALAQLIKYASYYGLVVSPDTKPSESSGVVSRPAEQESFVPEGDALHPTPSLQQLLDRIYPRSN